MKKKYYIHYMILFIMVLFLTSCGKKTVQQKLEDTIPLSKNPGKLKVVLAVPYGSTSDQSQLDQITVTFNQAMSPLTSISDDSYTGSIKFDPDIKGKYRWISPATLSFTPETPLPPGTKIDAEVPAGTRSLNGVSLEKSYKWSFETLRPAIKESYPANEQKLVGLKDKIYLLFNIPVNDTNKDDLIKLTEYNDSKKNLPITIRRLNHTDTEIVKKWSDQKTDNILVITPEEPLKPSMSYYVTISAGYKAKSGDLGLLKDQFIEFSTQNIFDMKPLENIKHDPSQELSIVFTNPVYLKELMKNISFTPEIKIPDYYSDNDYDSEYQRLDLNFQPDTNYKAVISSNMKDIFGNSLGKNITFKFKTTDYSPDIALAEGSGIIESRSQRQLPIYLLNIDKVRLQIAKISKDQVIPLNRNRISAFNNETSYMPYYGFYQVDKIWNVNPAKNQKEFLPIKLNQILPDNSNGIVFVQLSTLKKYEFIDHYLKSLIQVTNLGITAKFSPENNLIWVTTLDKALPVKNAFVEIRDDSNRILWRGKTNEEGLAETPGWTKMGLKKLGEYGYTPELWVFATYKNDTAFINSGWGWGIATWLFDVNYNWNPDAKECEGSLFTEKGLYRRGDDVNIKGIFREKEWGKWIVSDIKNINIRINNSRDENIFKKNVSLSDFGSFSKKIKLSKDSPTGLYRIEMWYLNSNNKPELSATGSFRVEDFKTADFKVTVNSKEKSYILKETFDGNIQGWYLFGAPMSGDNVSWKLGLNPYSFVPKGYNDYYFGPFYDEDMPDQSVNVASGEGKLDRSGSISIKAPLSPENIRQTMKLSVEGTVKSTDRTELSGFGDYVVHKGNYYIGVKPSSSFIDGKTPQNISLVTVTPEGDKRSGIPVKVDIFKRIWHSVRKTGISGSEWITEKKDDLKKSYNIRTSSNSTNISFTPDEPGYYIIRATGKDNRQNEILSEAGFYASGSGYVPWKRTEDDIVELISDKKEYKPGETARIIVKSPYEKARALVTFEREFIKERKVIEINGSADVIECPIKADDLPNLFVSVVLLQGRTAKEKFSEYGEDLAKPSFKIGYINLPIISDNKKLKVTVTSDKKNYKPSENVNVKIKITDNDGQPVTAETTLAAVDNGVLSLINYKTPNYYPDFYGPQPLLVQNAESRLHVIGQRDYGEKGESRGGGGGIDFSAIALRSNFKDTAYWNPCIITNKSGEANISFTLPENLTTFRLMAVAQTKNSCFGSGENEFTVSKPLLMKPSHPSFVRIGDSFKAGVTIFNGTDKEGKVAVELDLKGLVLDGSNRQEISISANQQKEVLFLFKAVSPGNAELNFKAVMNNETDGLKCNISVKQPIYTITTALTGNSTNNITNEKIVIPDNILSVTGGLFIDLSSTAMVGLNGSIDYLVHYDYECLEQRLSRIYPGILAQNLVESFNFYSNLKEKAYRNFIQSELDLVSKYQKPDGSFTLWLNGETGLEYISCYAMNVLTEAEKAGYIVNKTTINKGSAYLRKLLSLSLDHPDLWHVPIDKETGWTIKSYALYDLYLMDKKDPSYISLLFENKDNMTLFGKALLLKTIYMSGSYPEYQTELLRIFLNKIKVSPTTAHFEENNNNKLEWIYDSNVKTTAIILQTLLETDNSFPYSANVVKWLISQQKAGCWQNTQDNVYAFNALKTYFNKYEKDTPDYTCNILLNKANIGESSFKGRQQKIFSKNIPMQKLITDKNRDLTFDKKGKGRMYYTVRLKYAPKNEIQWIDEGFAVIKTIAPLESYKNTTVFQAGQIYKVTLNIITASERTFVVVDDPLPGGFIVVNTDFSTERKDLVEKLKKMRQDDNKNNYYFADTFDHWEIYEDKVTLFANSLSAGEHNFTYLIRAQYFGTYNLPATKAEQMYEPEVFGYSRKELIEIK